jgi:site-specific DNA-methyltransferase (adenine-specific)
MFDSVFNNDCLTRLDDIEPSSIDLIYLDPPFFTQKIQKLKPRNSHNEYCFNDKWKSVIDYRNYIKERLEKCKRVLKDEGSLFLHCDRSASHHLRVVLDDVFGFDNFQSEIVWYYRRWSNSKKGLLNAHQIIFFYSKTSNYKFNQIYDKYSPTTNVDQIFQKRTRNENGKAAYKKADDGTYDLMDKKKGVPLSDVWEIPYLNPKAKERVGYPTQKPILLLERIILLATNENDIVLDPFCGSGTTLVAAKLLNRRYIGIDISKEAVSICNKRLDKPIRTESFLLQKGKDAYENQSEDVIEILDALGATPVQRNKGIDGFLVYNGEMRPIPIKIQRKDETIEKAISLLEKASIVNGYKNKILVKTNKKKEPTLFPIENDNNEILIVNNLKNAKKEIERFLSNTFQ